MAIAIPVFTNQLEKSRDAVSVANMRSAYAEAQTAALTGIDTTVDTNIDSSSTYDTATSTGTIIVTGVAIKSQKANGWSGLADEIGFINTTVNKIMVEGLDSATIAATPGNYKLTFTYDGGALTKVELN